MQKITQELSDFFNKNNYQLLHAVMNKRGMVSEEHRYCFKKDGYIIKLSIQEEK